jgi:hypothetical protein
MNIFWPESLQKLADSGEITFKDGERLNLNLIRRMDNGLFLIGLKGKTFTADLQTQPEGKTVRAEVVRNDNGTLQLRIIPKAENSANPMQMASKNVSLPKMQVQTTTAQISANTQSASQAVSQNTQEAVKTTPAVQNNVQQKLIFQIQAGTADVKPGDKVTIQILKTLDNGNTLVSLKNNLFEVKLDSTLMKNIPAEVIRVTDEIIQLAAAKMPVTNLDSAYVKQQVGGLDIEKIMKAFGKFQKLDIASVTPENLKNAIRNSGLFMENRLLNDENITGDEKLRAIINSDNPAKDGITKMQITNMLLAGGIFAFLKTKDENIDDTYMRLKKGGQGQNVLYVSTQFSKLGSTMLIIRNVKDTFDIMVKTEENISEQLKEIQIPNTRIHWFKYTEQDKNAMDVKNDVVINMGNFEVII